jgi:hypothetical protein
MSTFEITYGELERTLSGVFHWFDVRSGETEARVGVGLSHGVRRQWGLGGVPDAEHVEETERRVAVGHLKDHHVDLPLRGAGG